MTSSSAPNGCPRARPGCAGLLLRWQVFRDGTTHIRAECAACGAFVRYVRQTPEAIRRAGPPPTPGGEA
ncbi:MAG: hypothetical protein L6R43_00190 [Planctomycetes bacterium]|nr:hypothetical protein [Planctomycetota bacterium]MCK6530887.1 hypothetical protein [Myxococcota bacterium]